MDCSQAGSSMQVRAPAQGKGKNRKFWTRAEEDACIKAVKELIAKGWKAGNGWRPGFFGQVEEKIHKMIPGSNIRADPHVLSKITVWKKDYGALRSLFGKSGQGLDPEDWTINIVGTEQWEKAIRINPDLEKMKAKPFPLWEDWQEMFGRDRANGDGAVDVGSTIQDILLEEQMEGNNFCVGGPSGLPNNLPGVNEDEEDDAMSGARAANRSNASTLVGSKKGKGKRAAEEMEFNKMVSSFMSDTKEAISELSKAICALKEVDPAVNKLYAVMEELPELTIDQRVVAANKIAASQTSCALFFTMGVEAKISFVRNVLDGYI